MQKKRFWKKKTRSKTKYQHFHSSHNDLIFLSLHPDHHQPQRQGNHGQPTEKKHPLQYKKTPPSNSHSSSSLPLIPPPKGVPLPCVPGVPGVPTPSGSTNVPIPGVADAVLLCFVISDREAVGRRGIVRVERRVEVAREREGGWW